MTNGALRGWVYVASNPSLDGLLKIGFSMKDPTIRIRDFDSAALPTPYRLEFDMVVVKPRMVEQSAHLLLGSMKAGREWFRCTLEQATNALQRAANQQQGSNGQAPSPQEWLAPDTSKRRTPDAAFMKALTPSPALAAIVGDRALTRSEVTKKVWEYIRKNGLQDAAKKTMINADANLKEIFKQTQVSMFEMTKLINQHLK